MRETFVAIVLSAVLANCGGNVSTEQAGANISGSAGVSAGGANGQPGNAVSWSSGNVTLSASDFALVIGGQNYLANNGTLTINSDPGTPTYTSLELQWTENGNEMRLYIYFKADTTHWWSSEIRTLDGQPQSNWIYYYGDFFERPLGESYVGDLVLQNNGPNDVTPGTIVIHNLRLLPTFHS